MKFWDNYIKVIIAEGIAVFLVIISILILKFGFKGAYLEFVKWYGENVLTDTDIYEVIE